MPRFPSSSNFQSWTASEKFLNSDTKLLGFLVKFPWSSISEPNHGRRDEHVGDRPSFFEAVHARPIGMVMLEDPFIDERMSQKVDNTTAQIPIRIVGSRF